MDLGLSTWEIIRPFLYTIVFFTVIALPFLLIRVGFEKLILLTRDLIWGVHDRGLARSATKKGIGRIDKMSGIEFERCLKGLFDAKGFKSWTTDKNDFGGDVIIEKDGVRIAVQAKRYGPKNKVGPAAVRDVYASLPHHNCQKGMVITNSLFTEAAKIQAIDCGIELWDRNRLIKELNSEGIIDVNELVATTAEENSSCARCGIEIEQRVADYCRKRPERFKGKIYCQPCQKEIR